MPLRARPNLTLETKLSQMRLTLAPIYPLPSGPSHPSYPHCLLQFWLLTEDQLDSLARYYHQLSPTNPWHTQYPSYMNWDPAFLAKPDPAAMSKEEMNALLSAEERVSIKRRMFGKFIGLRGCETPLQEVRRKIKFLEERIERNILKDREMMGRKYMTPFYY